MPSDEKETQLHAGRTNDDDSRIEDEGGKIKSDNFLRNVFPSNKQNAAVAAPYVSQALYEKNENHNRRNQGFRITASVIGVSFPEGSRLGSTKPFQLLLPWKLTMTQSFQPLVDCGLTGTY